MRAEDLRAQQRRDCRDFTFRTGAARAKGTPKAIIGKLNAVFVEALAVRRIAGFGQEIFPRERQTPEALRAFQKAEIEKWWPIIKQANIKAE